MDFAELQGFWEISYQSTPQMPDWYEPGFGTAKIEGTKLTGVDGTGIVWDADLEISSDGSIHFKARLDPKPAPETSFLIDKNGNATRDAQLYSGALRLLKANGEMILRTRVLQGPLTIDVQFRKKQ
jgi:hypothetical protein